MQPTPLIQFFQSNVPASAEVLQQVAAHFEERNIAKNDFFLREGKISNEYLFLSKGFMRAFTNDTDGNEVTTSFYAQNGVVFEVSSFFMRTKSTENIQALTDCEGYAITYNNLNKLFHSIPEVREFGRLMLAKAFIAFKKRTLELINQPAEERYANLMLNNSEIFQYAQLKQVASYLGITDTSLSRIRKEFQKK